jgi:DNA-binding MarR family transcriptional regulator
VTTETQTAATSGYWYDDEAGAAPGVRVLDALREYCAAEAAMRKRTRESMGMGETDLLAIRLLLRAQRTGRDLGPKDLARALGISSASTTILVDRLVASGHVERRAHPTDRRALIVVPTVDSDSEVRATLDRMHSRMIAVADDLDASEAEVVTRFLRAMRDAVAPEE